VLNWHYLSVLLENCKKPSFHNTSGQKYSGKTVRASYHLIPQLISPKDAGIARLSRGWIAQVIGITIEGQN
jgi:hypothetical protein